MGAVPTIAVPFDEHRAVVRPEWIDQNRHMNMGYYLVVFDTATDAFLAWLGLDAAHRREQRVTTFALEAHVTYHREVCAGDPLRFTSRLLDYDAKRIHYFHEMWQEREHYLAATNELMSVQVSEVTRRSAPMAPGVLDRLAQVRAAHAALSRPPQVGRRIGLSERPSCPRPRAGDPADPP